MEPPEPEPFSAMKFTLNNGVKLPAIGFGTHKIRKDDEIMTVVDHALEAGYRLFDTAAVYGNEVYLKHAFQTLLPKHGLEREDIFVTTKLAPCELGSDITKRACAKSLKNLGLDYVDLYMIHFPGAPKISQTDPRNAKLRDKCWEALVEIYDDGKANCIGVSNFTMRHLKDLMHCNYGVTPTVNQVEWHPHYHQEDLLGYCKANDIVIQAYCSFGGASSSNLALLEDPVVMRIAKKLDVTCAQLLLVWSLQNDIAVIPKSMNPEHIKKNIAHNFRIPDEDMRALNALGKHEKKYAWDPRHVL